MLSYGPWLAEMRLGQYNLTLAALAIALPMLENCRPGRRWGFLLGAGVVLEVLMKPTQILMIPWMLSGAWRSRARLSRIAVGAFALVGLLAWGYSVQFGFDALIRAHRSWIEFLPLSTAKHFLRPDNLGLPTLMARFLDFGPGVSSVLLLLGLAIAVIFSMRAPLGRVQFLVASVLATILSPMAWRQNYVVPFLLLNATALAAFLQRSGRERPAVVFVPLLLFQILTTDLLGVDGYFAFAFHGGPLVLLLVSFWGATRLSPPLP